MNSDKPPPFSFKKESESFYEEYHADLMSLLDTKRAEVIPRDNMQSFNHGRTWSFKPVDSESSESGSMELHSTEVEFPFKDILQYDLGCIKRSQEHIVKSIMDEFMKSMYKTLQESTDKTGNVVHANGKPFSAELFLELLKKIEFGVDKNGEVTLPEFHVAPGMAENIHAQLTSSDEKIGVEIEKIIEEKKKIALDREMDRKSKYPNKG